MERNDVFCRLLTMLTASAILCAVIPLSSAGLCFAAPDQPRMQEQARTDALPASGSSQPRFSPKQEDATSSPDGGEASEDEASAYSDPLFLSTLLAREEVAFDMSTAFLSSADTDPKVREWADDIRKDAGESIRSIKSMLREFGQDMEAYRTEKESLQEFSSMHGGMPATDRYVAFLMVYCAENMQEAIPALMDSPHEEIAQKAGSLLVRMAEQMIQVRQWLMGVHDHRPL